MKQKFEKNELFQASHLTILVSFTIFATVLIGESLLLGWETWALLLIALAVIACWVLHIQNRFSDNVRLWIYSTLVMCNFFFYGIHLTSTYDMATVMCAVILLFTMTGIKSLITLCQVTYFITLGYDVVAMILIGEKFDALLITRTLLHAGMIVMTGAVGKIIIDKWMKVLGTSRTEIEQLTDATDRLNDFLANVSHEIRTPVNAVIGLSGICADKEKNEELRTDMIAVNAAGRRVADQISDILDYSEIDRGNLARNDEDYMLSSVLNDLVNEIRPVKSEDIELVIDVAPSIPSVMNTDVSKLKKILRHLIVNGLKYTREGGVYVRLDAIKQEYGVNLCIEVSDTGIGMSPEEIERMTERFYQANSSRTRSSSGLGLGMSIVSGFVASLGGFMKLESKLGVGTTVRVSVPQKVVDDTSCMSVVDREKLCLGAFLHFEKFPNPQVREYYNLMVRNIVRGLGVQMHRVDNAVNLNKLLSTVRLTHLFVGPDEYEADIELMEKLARKMTVVIVANGTLELPRGSRARIMEKPFYCFPVAAVLNEGTGLEETENGVMRCEGVEALVVDDEPMNLTVAKSVFGRYGMIVSTASSGQESVDMCSQKAYDIVFMDHMMPGMDGVEAMKRIRTDPHRARNDLPIVALTANAVSTAREMFMREGFDGFVSKPIDLLELERVLKKVLPKSLITYVDAPVPTAKAPAAPISAPAAPAAPAPEPEAAPSEPERSAPVLKPVSAPAPKPAPEPVPEPVQTPAHSAQPEPDDMFGKLEKLGVDTESGFEYCMRDEEFYCSLLKQYTTEAPGKRAKMEMYFAVKDCKNYQILVHALKSTSKMIGCMDLSEKAKALETAAKEDNIAYINENHADVMKQYKALTEGLNELLGMVPASPASPEPPAPLKPSAPPAQDDGGDDEPVEFAPDSGSGDDDPVEFAPDSGSGDDEVVEFTPDSGSGDDDDSGEVFEFFPQGDK